MKKDRNAIPNSLRELLAVVWTIVKSGPLARMTAAKVCGRPAAKFLILSSAFIAWPVLAQTYSVLHTFSGADGANPSAGVTRDSSGNLYGITNYGGAFGAGAVFKLDASGDERVLHSFTGGTDGGLPQNNNLILDRRGNIYGMTTGGGSADCPSGCGVVFELHAGAEAREVETILHSFTGAADGYFPFAGLIRDEVGNFYGSAEFGGSGAGVIFRLSNGGVFDVLHSFSGGSDGGCPDGSLLMDRMGELFGVATCGGSFPGAGAIFKMTPDGTVTVLHNFTGGNDGSIPIGPLVRDVQGNLFGVTQSGGSSGQGVVFKLDPSGTERVLYTFSGGADGASPAAGLTLGASGDLYGTTLFGGSFGLGVVFKVSADGTEAVLHTFTGGADGANPFGAVLVRDSQGNLYGTAYGGGNVACTCGVVFKVTPRSQ